ncbi:hypothetical protein HPB47_016795 [Ixodes persulcatus]|uniref:Uncharacterized protein n=1 Tax=Ixodes persulcatus TaxID=34615 RepID=A0AC60QQ67_IXOPE|nr:hypothetical protein HPB47_016795 [Ixodes persulcatus]
MTVVSHRANHSSDKDVRDTSKKHDSYTLPESLYERQLQQLLNNGSVPTTPSVPTDEFSATEEEENEEPQVIPEDNSDEEDGGTPLQKGPTAIFPLSSQSVRFNLSNSSGVNETVHPKDMAGHSAATTPAVGKPWRMSMAVKGLIVLVVITVNVLIYLRTPKISAAPNCVVWNGGVKWHLEEPDLLHPKKKKPKVAASVEPTINLTPARKEADGTEGKEKQTTECREERKTKYRAMPTKTRPLHRTTVPLPMTPRAVTEQGMPLSSATAELETKSEPHFFETQDAFEGRRGDSV